MDFPPESVAAAQQIAEQYRRRSHSIYHTAQMLYKMQFLELGYGFDDGIKRGRCGTFLHEAERDAECFSMMGMLYIIAREAGLNPKMYQALKYRKWKEGTDPAEEGTSDHGFITVQPGKKEIIVDPFMSVLGEMKNDEDKNQIRIYNSGDAINTYCSYAMLSELSETAFLDEMARCRSSEGGQRILKSGQVVSNRRRRIKVVHDDSTLRTSSTFLMPNVIPVPEERYEVFSIKAPVENDGGFDLDTGTFTYFRSADDSWLPEERRHTGMMELPMETVLSFLEHIDIAARHHGRKTSVQHIKTVKVGELIRKWGFDEFGQLTKDNGVDPAAHEKLLDAIACAYEERPHPELIDPFLDREGEYLLRRMANVSGNNPQGLLNSPAELDAQLESGFKWIHDSLLKLSEGRVDVLRAKALGRSLYHATRKVTLSFNQAEQEFQRYDNLISTRTLGDERFYDILDMALSTAHTPIGSVTSSDEGRLLAWRKRLHSSVFVAGTYLVPAVQIKPYRKGLERILAR